MSRNSGKRAARVPFGTRVYAIGDIHGQREVLEKLHALIIEDARRSAMPNKVVVYLGDYVDRGPDSREVVDLLVEAPLPGFTSVHLMGNHEAFLLQFLNDSSTLRTWMMNGGIATLESYGVNLTKVPESVDRNQWLRQAFLARLSQKHRAFYCDLTFHHVEGDYVFAHAGLRPGVPIDDQDPFDLIWIREPFLSSAEDFGKVVVHGHTPASRPVRASNRIGIDTGAAYGGPLTALVLEDRSQSFLQA